MSREVPEGPHEQPVGPQHEPMALRVGLHNGTLDEIVGSGYFHLEQMDEGSWCLNFATPKASGTVWLSARGKIKAQYEVTPNA